MLGCAYVKRFSGFNFTFPPSLGGVQPSEVLFFAKQTLTALLKLARGVASARGDRHEAQDLSAQPLAFFAKVV